MKKEKLEINVKEIMKEIKSNVNKKIQENSSYKKDIERIKKIKIKKTHSPENIESNLHFINQNYDIYKIGNQKSERKIIGKIINKVRDRIKVEVSYIIKPIITNQIDFNAHVTRLFNGLIKTIK